jgi:hypothetical protein
VTQSGDESASLDIGCSGKFDLDCDRLTVVPLTKTVQTIGKILERSVLRQHKRKRTVFERHRHAASPRFLMLDVEHRALQYW